jgi:AmmeMemoRadiSam system protein A
MTGAADHYSKLPEKRPDSAIPDDPKPISVAPMPACPTPGPALSPGQCRFLLQLARRTIEAAVRQQPNAAPVSADLDPPLLESRACFVTLEKQSALRGCIGHLIPQEPLYEAVMNVARQAALADPRFARVQPDELAEISIDISVLSPLIPLAFHSVADLLAQIEPFRHGVVLHLEDRTSTFLPQVWDKIPEKADFLDRLALKGGWEPSAWRDARARISVYEVESFHEPH